MISENLVKIRDKISVVCRRLGRNPSEVVLVGVSKYAQVAQIKEAMEAGLKNIGENRIQEAQEKFAQLAGVFPGITKHMIGHLQTNKVKYAVELFDLIQSVDRLELIQEIEKQAQKRKKKVDVLLEVKTSGEEQKTGIAPEETFSLIDAVSKCEHIRLLGLMTMAPTPTYIKSVGSESRLPLTAERRDGHSIHEIKTRNCFRQLKKIFEQAKETFAHTPHVEMKYLSMGMSDDFEIAIEEGSNMVRIGRAIFSGE